MEYILIPIIIALCILVVISLVRGIVAFMQSTRDDLNREEGAGASEMQLRQNKMMFARIKYQALAVIVVALLIAMSR